MICVKNICTSIIVYIYNAQKDTKTLNT